MKLWKPVFIANKKYFILLYMVFVSSNTHAVIIPTLTFTTPSATISVTDTVEVWVTLSLDPLSDPFTFDDSILPFGGVPEYLIPTEIYQFDLVTRTFIETPFESYTRIAFVHSTPCHQTFTDGCKDTGEYRKISTASSPDSWNNVIQPFTMNPGDSRDFLIAEYTPRNGTVDEGMYTLESASLSFFVYGLDIEGNTLLESVNFADTCQVHPDCDPFTRNVSTIPVPSAFLLFATGIVGLGKILFRK